MPPHRSGAGPRREPRPPARLRDRIGPNVRVLFVGINPGIRSAAVGHHFAGPSNRFWKLLYESGLVPEPLTWSDDGRLPRGDWASRTWSRARRPGSATCTPANCWRAAVCSWRGGAVPALIVALVGVTIYRALFPELARGVAVPLGETSATLAGARVFVLPNPSGRNANYSYAEMLDAFRRLGEALRAEGATDL